MGRSIGVLLEILNDPWVWRRGGAEPAEFGET